ncbi:nucleotidyltransferase family protein [Arcticibacter sp. MXS-1]|uniref:nucleotidyltransferase family protein n=1 Tax=Arcticibacter sp. MXS-1 TaxID=3341726 RepID=UPI0035A81F6E
MEDFERLLIAQDATLREALRQIDRLAIIDVDLFVVASGKLIGSLSEGDIRRALLDGSPIEASVDIAVHRNFTYFTTAKPSVEDLAKCRRRKIRYVPVVGESGEVTDIIDVETYRPLLPVEAVIMAGGRGERLRPLTDNCPKPLLKVGSKPIIEHNIDRLAAHGVRNIHISVNYLGYMLKEHFGDGAEKKVSINYVDEDKPMGTIGAITRIESFSEDTVLVMNSDLLTDIDIADFYEEFQDASADMAVAASSYKIDIPYAVLEVNSRNEVVSLKEKPRYTYFSNAGIYLIKKSLISMIPAGQRYDMPTFMDELIMAGRKILTYPIRGYWLDIGRIEDYMKAQEDIRHLKL